MNDEARRLLGEFNAVVDPAMVPSLGGQVVSALLRIADALEARNAIDAPMAEMSQFLLQGAPQVEHIPTNPDLAPDGLPRKRR